MIYLIILYICLAAGLHVLQNVVFDHAEEVLHRDHIVHRVHEGFHLREIFDREDFDNDVKQN